MAPYPKEDRDMEHFQETLKETNHQKAPPNKYKIVYPNVMIFLYGHLAALYGLYLFFTSAKWQTLVLFFIFGEASGYGITAGAHRLWAHRTYKAKLPLQILLMLLNCVACQNTVITWARDHRLHHKHSDTDADPHNSQNGLFFSHIGWLMVKKHDEVKNRGKELDMSDLLNNPVLQFQKKFAVPLFGAICFVLPTVIPMYFWGETLSNAWHITLFRYVLSLNVTWLVNSAAHFWGTRPYDKSIAPRQNIAVSILTNGEGFHNYHHVFPWDYRTAELGNNSFNMTTKFIDFFAWIGWAYDLKSTPQDLIQKRSERTGDGKNIWGWGDKDMCKEQKDDTIIFK